ncbi:MAG: hypothetical protein ACFFD1_05625 [Candidatus Thorarchaeota archaeon]
MPNCSICGIEISEEQYSKVGLCSVCYLTKTPPKYYSKSQVQIPRILKWVLIGILAIITIVAFFFIYLVSFLGTI